MKDIEISETGQEGPTPKLLACVLLGGLALAIFCLLAGGWTAVRVALWIIRCVI